MAFRINYDVLQKYTPEPDETNVVDYYGLFFSSCPALEQCCSGIDDSIIPA